MNIIPSIGTTGIFQLSEKFAPQLVPDVVYTVRAIRSLQDYIGLGGDPKTDYYDAFGLTETDYSNDLANHVCIVSLQSTDGSWVYVPSSQILAYPEVNGVPYTSMAIAVFLGAIPDSLNLDYTVERIGELVLTTLGITPDIHTTAVSAQTMLSQSNHELAETARQDKISTNITERARLITLQTQNAALQQKVTELETFIKSTL